MSKLCTDEVREEISIMDMENNKRNHGVDEVLRMKEGVDESSYHQNSMPQANCINRVKDLLEKSAHETTKRHGKSCQAIQIVDMGCSSSKKTLDSAKLIIKGFHNGFKENKVMDYCNPEILYIFNDLPSNDFNTLFQRISHEDSEMKIPGVFTAAAAGSFHGRLFPANSLHFVYSTHALHWLSKVPDEVYDRDSPAWNPGNVHFNRKAQPEVEKVYWKEFQHSFGGFLQSRAEEVVSRGRLFFVLSGMDSKETMSIARGEVMLNIITLAFRKMVNKGLVSQEVLDLFNVPMFFPYIEDVKGIIERHGEFELHQARFVKNSEDVLEGSIEEKKRMGKAINEHAIAIFGTLIENYIGKLLASQLFGFMDEIVDDIWQESVDIWCHGGFMVVELVRK